MQTKRRHTAASAVFDNRKAAGQNLQGGNSFWRLHTLSRAEAILVLEFGPKAGKHSIWTDGIYFRCLVIDTGTTKAPPQPLAKSNNGVYFNNFCKHFFLENWELKNDSRKNTSYYTPGLLRSFMISIIEVNCKNHINTAIYAQKKSSTFFYGIITVKSNDIYSCHKSFL